MRERERTLLVVAVLVFALLAVAPIPASAEGFGDLYLGGAFTMDEDVTVRGLGLSVKEEVDFDTSFTLGGRIGYWFEGSPSFGIALDVSFFQPDGEDTGIDADITVVPISALLMLRFPLQTSEEFPKGRLQPYLGVGPGLFITKVEQDVTLDSVVVGDFSDRTTDLGLDARAGLAWLFQKNFAIFAEYRFTHVEPEVKDNVAGVTVEAETDLDTHYFLVGISYRF
ncbi:MAG: outer membrane protein [Nitrospinota bacterium]